MTVLLSEKRILYFSFVVCFLLAILVGQAIGEDAAEEDIAENEIGIITQPSPELLEDARIITEGFLKPGEKDTKIAETIKEKSDKIIENQIRKDVAEAPAVAKKVTCNFNVSYLVSFSMPGDTIENVVRDALQKNEDCGKNVASVGIRGFIGGDLKKTLKTLYQLSRVIRKDLPIRIQHDLFRQYNVEEVPFIVVKTPVGVKTVRGDVNIDYAVNTAHDGETIGTTYTSIIEEDWNAMVARKAAAATEKLKKRQYEVSMPLTKYEGRFRKAEKDATYYVDPTYEAPDDIKDTKGNVLIAKNTKVHPADYAPMGKYIIINGDDDNEIKYAIRQNARAIIIVSGDPVKLMKKHNRKFYIADDLLVHGLELTKTPSIIEQEGRYIRVTEKKL